MRLGRSPGIAILGVESSYLIYTIPLGGTSGCALLSGRIPPKSGWLDSPDDVVQGSSLRDIVVPRLPDHFQCTREKIGEPVDEANRYHAGSMYLHACTTLSISSLVPRLPDLFQRTREKDRGAWGRG